MIEFFKKYWDIFGGMSISIVMAVISHFQLQTIQLCYSIIILILVSIGLLRIIKQSVDKSREKKRQTLIDQMVDGQQAIKAISIAQNPTRDGEKLGKIIITLWEGVKSIMKKFKELFDKFKGIVLAIALGILTAVEMYGGHINALCGGVFVINGVAVLPAVTLACAVIVGIISNGWTKEQREKINALFSRSSTDEIVLAEIKKTLKENEAKVKEFNKVLATKKTELDNLNGELETKQNTHSSKVKMASMTPRLATDEDVHLALLELNAVQNKIAEKKREIAEVETTIANLNSTISALKSQL